MQRHFFWITCWALVACVLLPSAVTATPKSGIITDYTAEPLPGDTYTLARFRIFVPSGVDVLRGVYFYVAPLNSDSRPYAENPTFQALCANSDFAMMGAQLNHVHMDSGIGNAVLRALSVFAGATFKPELEHAALFLEGYSWGGQFSYHFTKWLPERVIGFVTEKGGYHDTAPAGEAIYVPGYLFIGENDLPYRLTNLTGIFEEHRPLGARWILAMQPGAGHEPITDRFLLDAYFRTVIELRVPAYIPPDQPVDLHTIPESLAWLGNRESHLIGSWQCYDAASDSACWFVSPDVGKTWQAFVSSGTVTDTIPCTPAAVNPTVPTVTGHLSGNRPNPFNPITTIGYHIALPGTARLTIHDTRGRLITTLVDAAHQVGDYEVDWNGTDDLGRRTASGAYFCRLEIGGQTTVSKMVLLQ